MKPPLEAIVLARLAHGHTAEELERVRTIGRTAWVKEQLRAPDGDDPAMKDRLAKATLRIEYAAEKDKFPALKEDRPLRALDAPLKDLWPLRDYSKNNIPWQERVRPRDEVVAATWLRARYAQYQLREVLVGFWHDHFHVNALHDDIAIAVTWPLYDRIVRRHALGNFRDFLEDVATSTPMLVYLNNRTSKASPANENYARELFELHALGADAYLNHLYNRWREVPGATKGSPAGYIDQDVYEAARAFTGWTIEDGSWSPEGLLPNTGAFTYHAAWHDPYQKRVLGVELDANAPPLSDGRRVLDLVHEHPATARHVCTKLVRRLVADNPPKRLVDRAVSVWRANLKSKDQIARVVEAIALSDEFGKTWGQKAKRPFEFVVSLLRASGTDYRPEPGLPWLALTMGERPFGWPTPDGPPDAAEPWLSANSMMGRWNAAFWLMSKGNPATAPDFAARTPDSVKTLGQAADFWAERLLPFEGREVAVAALKETLASWAPLDSPLVPPQSNEALSGIVAMAALAPEFNLK